MATKTEAQRVIQRIVDSRAPKGEGAFCPQRGVKIRYYDRLKERGDPFRLIMGAHHVFAGDCDMTKAIGDTVFNGKGLPGIVTRINGAGETTIETHGPEIKKAQSRGYINGLRVEERAEYNQIIDQVNRIEEPKEKIALLQNASNAIKDDPSKNIVKKYLDSEINHLMIIHRIRSREYTVDSSYLR